MAVEEGRFMEHCEGCLQATAYPRAVMDPQRGTQEDGSWTHATSSPSPHRTLDTPHDLLDAPLPPSPSTLKYGTTKCPTDQ